MLLHKGVVTTFVYNAYCHGAHTAKLGMVAVVKEHCNMKRGNAQPGRSNCNVIVGVMQAKVVSIGYVFANNMALKGSRQ